MQCSTSNYVQIYEDTCSTRIGHLHLLMHCTVGVMFSKYHKNNCNVITSIVISR